MTLVPSDEEGLGKLTPQDFIGSALFEKTFEEGMSLVEETAKYLDGPGREQSRDLPRKPRVPVMRKSPCARQRRIPARRRVVRMQAINHSRSAATEWDCSKRTRRTSLGA